jgi:hypothetical protein
MLTKELTRTQRLLRLVIACRKQVANAKRRGLTDRLEIAEAARRRTRKLALEHFDDVHFNFIEMNAMNDKRAARHGLNVLTGQFILGELFTVVHDETTLYLERAELTLVDGDRITAQKQANIKSAIRAAKEWDWEWGQISRPLLVINPTWRYRDAYEHLLKNGGLPTPPSFDDDEK